MLLSIASFGSINPSAISLFVQDSTASQEASSMVFLANPFSLLSAYAKIITHLPKKELY